MADAGKTHLQQASALTPLDVLLAVARNDARFLSYPNGRARFDDRVTKAPHAARAAILLALPLTGPVDRGLHFFFRTPVGDLAHELHAVMTEVGFMKEARLVENGMKLCGAPYPVDHSARSQLFSRGFHAAGQTRPDPQTATDKAMKALDRQFLADTRYALRLSELIDNNPDVILWLSTCDEALSDDERLSLLMARAFRHDIDVEKAAATDAALARIPEPFGTLFMLGIFEAELANGGVHQFFFNFGGGLAPSILGVLRSNGADRAAATLDKALAMFGGSFPRDTDERRQRFFAERDWNEWDERLQALSDGIDHGELRGLMIAFAKRFEVLPRLSPPELEDLR